MKTLLLVLVTFGVSGCVVYPAPHGAYGDRAYRYNAPSHSYDSNYPSRAHDQDRDGVPDRRDRDRDGDGVPNRWDSQPSDPRRR